jgi:hypothetical protein
MAKRKSKRARLDLPGERATVPAPAIVTIPAPPPEAMTLAPPASAPVDGDVDEYTVITPLLGPDETAQLRLDARSALVLTHADGHTPLRAIFQRLALSREEVLEVVAELSASGIACLGTLQSTPPPVQVKTSELRLRDLAAAALRKTGG